MKAPVAYKLIPSRKITKDLSFSSVTSKTSFALTRGLLGVIPQGGSGGCRYTNATGARTLAIPAKITKVPDNPLCSIARWRTGPSTMVPAYWPAVHMPLTSAKCLKVIRDLLEWFCCKSSNYKSPELLFIKTIISCSHTTHRGVKKNTLGTAAIRIIMDELLNFPLHNLFTNELKLIFIKLYKSKSTP